MATPAHANRHRIADLVILGGLLCLVLWYFWDAYSASTHVTNLILILPVTGLVLILCAVEFIGQVREKDREIAELEPVSTVMPAISLFVAFVLTLPWLGFDVGTFLFVSLFLWFHGERRWQWALGYGLCFASVIALFFSTMLPYPMPMLLLPTDY